MDKAISYQTLEQMLHDHCAPSIIRFHDVSYAKLSDDGVKFGDEIAYYFTFSNYARNLTEATDDDPIYYSEANDDE